MSSKVKKKTSISEAEKLIRPYLTKRLFHTPYIESKNVQKVSDLLKHTYSNVTTDCRQENGRAVYTVIVKGFLNGGSHRYEIRHNGKRIVPRDPLAWIDRFEEWDALFND